MVLFAALALVALSISREVVREPAAGRPAACATTLACMVALACAIERLVLRAARQPGRHHPAHGHASASPIVLDGLGQLIFGSHVYKLDLGMPKDPICRCSRTSFDGGLLVNLARPLRRPSPPARWSPLLALFFQKTRTGRALRAVADDHQAAQSVGIPLGPIWVIVWSGRPAWSRWWPAIVWGGKLGVQYSISLVALKALPGADPGRPHLGARRHRRRADHRRRREAGRRSTSGRFVGGGIENWFAYVLALAFLLVRPQGLFGDKHHRARESVLDGRSRRNMFYRENRPVQDQLPRGPGAVPDRAGPLGGARRCALVAFVAVPLAGQRLHLPRGAHPLPDPVAGGAGPQHAGGLLRPDLAGHRRLHGRRRLRGLQPAGAHRRACRWCCRCSAASWPRRLSACCSACRACASEGFYLAVATLAAQFFIDWCHQPRALGDQQLVVGLGERAAAAAVRPAAFEHAGAAGTCCRLWLRGRVRRSLAKNLVRGAIGREWMAMRDMDVAAAVIGIRPVYAKLTAFAVSSFIVGVAGALWGFVHLGAWEPAAFGIDKSFQLLFMIIIGGLGSIAGSFFGARLHRAAAAAAEPRAALAGPAAVDRHGLAPGTHDLRRADRVLPDRRAARPGPRCGPPPGRSCRLWPFPRRLDPTDFKPHPHVHPYQETTP